MAIIRDVPLLTASTGIISRELIRNLRNRIGVEDMFCGEREKYRQIQEEIVKSLVGLLTDEGLAKELNWQMLSQRILKELHP